MAEARRLADEAAQAADEAAAKAHEEAQSLVQAARERDQVATRGRERAADTRAALADTAAHAVRAEQAHSIPENLPRRSKPELQEIAASLGIDATSQMTKTQLTNAIRRASRARAQ
jgi:membrane protein involved in colicin uptake